MLATTKQINYLNRLTNKVNYIYSIFPECGIPDEHAKFYRTVNWDNERKKGMTTMDASIKISAFKDLIRGINFKRYLMNQKQF